ncbi:sensor histidine kinase [Curtobacterium ammoniigenes]|uniref:sensor histidine kinase n=1 Tax=Curtobacterium ammoniigenes TaxID=395387 RepID=UPI00082A8E82|nr:ATP-binding protein [Curtobacterium ammoniigenes]
MAADHLPFGQDPARGVRAPITQATMDRAFAILLAVAAIGFSATTVPLVLAQLHALDPIAGPVSATIVGASIIFIAVGAVFQRVARIAQVVHAVVFLACLIAWPLIAPHGLPAGQVPWPWWLCNVATIAAAMGLSQWGAAAYTVLIPLVYAIIRVLPSGGGVAGVRASLDAVYIMILGGAALVLIVVLRRAASSVDRAQATAVARYARAIREHATELERVQVDAIVHDSVLTTLLSAARADTPEAQGLAASMAQKAIEHLDAATRDADDDAPVTVESIRCRIAADIDDLAAPFALRVSAPGALTVPAPVADALVSATVQAAVNSVQHAGPTAVRRTIAVEPWHADGILVEVADDGIGFDVEQVPAARLGVRRSIVERVAMVGGSVRVLSAPGAGTRVVLRWSTDLAESADASGTDTLPTEAGVV